MDMSVQIASLEAKVAPETRQKLQASAKEYEAVFMTQMFSEMFKDVDLNPMSEGSSAAEDTYKGMLMTEYGKAMSVKGPGIGLAPSLYSALLQKQIASQQEAE